MNYQEAWTFLDNLQFFKIKLGLESMRRFLGNVDHPEEQLKFVHIAGTNGKGSVACTLLKLLAKGGYSVGLYTSPHLSSVRERFRINDEYISKDEFARHATRIRDTLNGKQITYFEFTTTLAMLWFQERNVDLAILEVGLGGRLDATNVITPLVSIITNVTMDHEAYLGDTLEQVANEKAGIIKSTVPVVSGVAKDITGTVIAETCQKHRAPLFLLDRDFSMEPSPGNIHTFHGTTSRSTNNLTLNMKGWYQPGNTALALTALELLEDQGFHVTGDTIRETLPEIHWPGRLEYFCLPQTSTHLIADSTLPGESHVVPCPEQHNQHSSPVYRFLLDGAHNPDGVKSLHLALNEEFTFRHLILVWASMSDKDYGPAISSISRFCHAIIFTMPESERSATPEQLRNALPAQTSCTIFETLSVREALVQALTIAQQEDLICVAGSLYLIGAAREILLGELIHDE
ncbi:bifunctional folylpolyglutamate synthase/dihydrofolate synthase [Thermodesulfobacteriota bacterium]